MRFRAAFKFFPRPQKKFAGVKITGIISQYAPYNISNGKPTFKEFIMAIEPVFEKLTVNEKIGETTCQMKVECKTDVPAESVERILNETACAVINLGEISDGRAEINGKATFFICYLTADGIKKCECGAEIKDALVSDAISPVDTVNIRWETDRVATDLSGLKATVSAYITVKAEIIKNAEYPVLTGGENVFCDLKSVKTVKTYGVVSSAATTEETFDLGYAVEEVISHRAEVCLTAVQCGVGTIICDGEIYLTEILLQSGEKNDIIRENRVITFRAEIECEDAMPQFSATCRAFVKSLKTDVSVDREKNISAVTAQVSVGLTGEAFAESEETFAADAFNTENQLALVKTRVNAAVQSAPVCTHKQISGKAAIRDVGAARVITAANEKIDALYFTKKDGTLIVSGALTVNALFADEDGKPFSVKADVPFETEIPAPDGENISVSAAIKIAGVKLITLTEIECEAEAIFSVYSEKNYATEVITAVTVGEPKTVQSAAVSVYIPLAGESLWGLAKRLNVCPETLVATNSDLQFPLTGKERIAVYRQK